MSQEVGKPIYGIFGGSGGWYFPVARKPTIPYFTYYAMSRTAQVIQNIAMQKLITDNIGTLQTNLNLMLGTSFSEIEQQKAGGPTGDEDRLKAYLKDQFTGLYDNWKAGVWHGVGSAYSSAMEQFLATGQYLYAYKPLAVQIGVTSRLRRHWMKTYTPTVQTVYMAWLNWKRGHTTEDVFDEYASYEGWAGKEVERFKSYMETWPSSWAAVRLFFREQINRAKLDSVFRQEGYGDFWFDRIIQAYRSLPTIGQAARMYLRSAIKDVDYMNYAKWTGWDETDAAHMMSNYLGYPSTREAFYMQRRAIIDVDTRNKIYMAQGYLAEWWPLITLNYQKIFNPLNAFKLYMRGKLTNAQFLETVYQNGWPRAQAPLFQDLYKNIPTSQEAFFWWTKGLINYTQLCQRYLAYGWMPEDWFNLTENYYYVPTLYDLFRIADAVEIDEIWAADVMTRRAIKPSDQAKLWPMLKIRPLRNEIARQVTVWVTRYSLGWTSDTELETALDDMIANGYIQTTEKDLITEEAILKYEDELMREQIEIWMWYFRMAAVTEAQYLDALLSMGIRREKANLMVEEQKAMGYYGYY